MAALAPIAEAGRALAVTLAIEVDLRTRKDEPSTAIVRRLRSDLWAALTGARSRANVRLLVDRGSLHHVGSLIDLLPANHRYQVTATDGETAEAWAGALELAAEEYARELARRVAEERR